MENMGFVRTRIGSIMIGSGLLTLAGSTLSLETPDCLIGGIVIGLASLPVIYAGYKLMDLTKSQEEIEDEQWNDKEDIREMQLYTSTIRKNRDRTFETWLKI